jgi:hypothetical protein
MVALNVCQMEDQRGYFACQDAVRMHAPGSKKMAAPARCACCAAATITSAGISSKVNPLMKTACVLPRTSSSALGMLRTKGSSGQGPKSYLQGQGEGGSEWRAGGGKRMLGAACLLSVFMQVTQNTILGITSPPTNPPPSHASSHTQLPHPLAPAYLLQKACCDLGATRTKQSSVLQWPCESASALKGCTRSTFSACMNRVHGPTHAISCWCHGGTSCRDVRKHTRLLSCIGKRRRCSRCVCVCAVVGDVCVCRGGGRGRILCRKNRRPPTCTSPAPEPTFMTSTRKRPYTSSPTWPMDAVFRPNLLAAMRKLQFPPTCG